MKKFATICLEGLMAIVMVAYIPLFFVGWVLHKIARLILAMAYCLLLDFRSASDIIKYLFRYGRK